RQMEHPIARRGAFRMVAAAAGAIGSMGLIGTSRAQSASSEAVAPNGQLSKQDAQYQLQPNGQQRCSLCANFFAPSGCRVIAGPVVPNAWCRLFKAKTQT